MIGVQIVGVLEFYCIWCTNARKIPTSLVESGCILRVWFLQLWMWNIPWNLCHCALVHVVPSWNSVGCFQHYFTALFWYYVISILKPSLVGDFNRFSKTRLVQRSIADREMWCGSCTKREALEAFTKELLLHLWEVHLLFVLLYAFLLLFD